MKQDEINNGNLTTEEVTDTDNTSTAAATNDNAAATNDNSTAVATTNLTGDKTPRLNYGQLLDFMNRKKPETDEEKAAREKREQRAIRFARIGDTLSAMHNAYANARGIQAMPQTTLADKMRARYDALRKEREANDAAYYNGYAKLLGMQNQEDYNNSMLEFRKAEAEAKRAAEEAARKREEAKMKETERHNRASEAAAMVRANKTGNLSEYTTETTVHRDNMGRETGRTTTRTKGRNGSSSPTKKPTKSGGSNTKKKPTMLNFT